MTTAMLTEDEAKLLLAAVALTANSADGEFHGWQLAKIVQQMDGARHPIAFGTLYRALSRLERFRYLDSRLEDPAIAEAEDRPQRRIYWLTTLGKIVHDLTVESPHAVIPPWLAFD